MTEAQSTHHQLVGNVNDSANFSSPTASNSLTLRIINLVLLLLDTPVSLKQNVVEAFLTS